MRSISNPPEDKFLEAYNNWDVEKLFRDLADVNIEKKYISSTAQKYLRGVLVGKSPKHIAQICSLRGRDPSYTVRKYLSDEIYPLIRQLLNLPEKEPIVYNKVPFLLYEYSLKNKNQLPNHFQSSQISETSQETEQNEQLVNTYSDNLNLQTLEDVTLYKEKFIQHCEKEEYIQAFYTIFDGDNYDNSVYKFLRLYGYNNFIISLYERLLHSWQPRKLEKWEFEIALTCLGDAYHRLGEYQKAIEKYEYALKIALEIDDFNGVSGSWLNLGDVYHSLEKYPEAINHNRHGLEIARQIGQREFEANALNNLGLVFCSLEQYHVAIDYYHHSLEIKQKIGDVQGEAGSLINIGDTHRNLEQYHEALEFLLQGIEVAHQSGHRQFEANGLFNLGLTLEQLGQELEAILAYENALELFQEMGLDASVEDCNDKIQFLS